MRTSLLACTLLFFAGCGAAADDEPRDLSAMPADLAVSDMAQSGDGGDCPSPPSSAYHPYLRVMAYTQSATPHQGATSIGWVTVGYSTGTAVSNPPRSCTFTPAPTGPPPPNAMEVHEPAGLVTIAGGTRSVVMAPDADNGYVFTDAGVVWPGGARLAIDIAGACDVPSSHFDVLMPKSVTAMTPAAGATVKRTSDLTVGWTAGLGDLSFDLWNASGGIHCVFDAAAGSGTVAASVLGQLAAGASTYNLGLSDQILTHIAGRVYLIEADTDVLEADGTRFAERGLTLQ